MTLSDEGRMLAGEVARRHKVSAEAVAELLRAVEAGRGTQAQFSHPELGGLGQWSRGGMIMIGDMFNTGLKAKVDALCTELSAAVLEGGVSKTDQGSQAQDRSGGAAKPSLFIPGGNWWPGDLGVASATGAQNDLRYAYYPATRRLAVDVAGAVTVYDTGDHEITGVSQQQGGDRTLSFTSQHGSVRLADLKVLSGGSGRTPEPEAASRAASAEAEQSPRDALETSAKGAGDADAFAKLERVAELHAKGILSDAEFESKKAELLARI